jgi:iron complex outermembrane recepter protein
MKSCWLNRLITLLVLCAAHFFACAQLKLGGRVVCEGKPVQFCTVSILLDSQLVINIITGKEGDFETAGLARGHYRIAFSHISYEAPAQDIVLTADSVITIVVTPKGNTLAEVKLNSKKPLITQKADRYIMNVDNSFLSTGYSALEILQRSPGLWVTSDGAIKLRGNMEVSVMIDGVMQRMPSDALAEYLRTLKSENILKIEVITSPGAEYDAEGTGGFVNIVLKKPRSQGFTGGVFLTYRQQGAKPYLSPGAVANLKTKNKTISLSYSGLYDASNYYAVNNVSYPNNSFYNTITQAEQVRKRHQLISRLVIDLPKKQLLAIQNVYSASDGDKDFITGMNMNFSGQPNSGNASSVSSRSATRVGTTINYIKPLDTLGSRLSIIADYTTNKSTDNLLFTSKAKILLPDSGYRNFSPFSTRIVTLQADYKLVTRHKLEIKTGSKYSHIKRSTRLLSENYENNYWIFDPINSNQFLYNEDIAALYVSLAKVIGKTEVLLGLRGELTAIRGNSLSSNQINTNQYTGLFPSLNILHTINKEKGHSASLGITRRLSRPDYTELNPYRLKIDNFTYQAGNPLLKPQYTYSFNTNLNLFNTYTLGLYYSVTNDVFISLASLKADNILQYQVSNFKSSKEAGFYANAPVKLTKWWSTNNEIRLYMLKYRLQNFKNTQTTFFARSLHNIAIKKVMDIDITSEYRSPYVYANAAVAYQVYCDIGFGRKILKNKGRIRLLITDLFDSQRDKINTDLTSTTIYFYQKRPTRTFGFSFSYTFSRGIKFNTRNVQQNNEEEKNRIERPN